MSLGAMLVLPINFGSLNAAGTNTVFQVVTMPMQILKWGYAVTTAGTTTALVMRGDILEADGTAASPTGAAALGTMTYPSTTLAANVVAIHDVEANEGRVVAYPGERLSLTVTTATTSGVVNPFALVLPLGWANANQRASGAPGSTTLATALAAVTELDS